MTSVEAIPADRWQPLLGALAEQLAAEKVLDDPRWRAAFTTVPRHAFVPEFYDDSEDPPRWVDATDPAWLPRIYSDDTLATQLLPMPGQPGNLYVTSSSTRPGYMLWLLHLLNLDDDMRVLEIGTGTGYNAALLSQRLGDRQVTSIDIDPRLVDLARRRLAHAGFQPLVAARDGATGHPDRAPYDRIIATVAVTRIPYAWVEQTRPGGIILADLRTVGMIRGGAIVKLTVHTDGTATGRLIDGGVGFMSARTIPVHPATPDVPTIDKTTVHHRHSPVGAAILNNPAVALTVWQHLPGITLFPRPDRIMITTPDGSWAEATHVPTSDITYGGPHDLWHSIEQATHQWQTAGKPTLDAYTITITPDSQHITPSLRPSSS